MQRGALFLDRDGVINRERGSHTWRVEDFEVLPDVPDAVHAAHEAGLRVVMVTNQSGIALGKYGHADVARLHALLRKALVARGAWLDGAYYCPHHPRVGRCLCRKPGSLMIERALARLAIDPARSLMIGDKPRDIEAARRAGVRGVLVEANQPLLPTLTKEGVLQ